MLRGLKCTMTLKTKKMSKPFWYISMGDMATSKSGKEAVMVKMIPKCSFVDSPIADEFSNCNLTYLRLDHQIHVSRSITLKGKAMAFRRHKLSQIGLRGDRFSSLYLFSSRGALLLLTLLTCGKLVFISNGLPLRVLPVFCKRLNFVANRNDSRNQITRPKLPTVTAELARANSLTSGLVLYGSLENEWN